MKKEQITNIEKQMLMEEIFNQLDIFAMILDDTRTIRMTNKKVKDEFGDVIGKKCYEIHHNTSKPPEFCAINKIINGLPGKETFLDNVFTNKWYDLSVSKIVLGDSYFYVHLMTDVNEKHIIDEKVLELNQALRVLNKILRHDILNNISVIMLSLEMMKTEDTTLKDKALLAIKKSIGLVDKMKELENAISSGAELIPYDVNLLLRESIYNYPKIKFEIDGNCNVLADEALLSVFNNLFSNAEIHGKADKVNIKVYKKDNFCIMKISDNGKGIPDKIRANLFEEGVSYGENRGLGLGLYIVKKTIGRYGGEVSFEDNSPNGTTFILKLKCVI